MKNHILLSNFDRVKKSRLFFWSCYSIEFIRHNSFKVYKFLKTGVHEKCILISSRGKFTWTFLPKIIVGIIDQEFLFWLCPMKLSIRHNSFILKHKCDFFFWFSYHFNTPFCVILQYPQSKREIYVKRKNNTQSSCMIFFSYFMSDGHIF